MTKQKKYYQGEPDYAVSPGSILADVLEQRRMTQIELANRLGLNKKTVNEIVKGNAPILADTATRLERVLGVSASFWLNAENLYQLRKKKRSENLGQYEDVLSREPIKELIKRKLLPKHETPEEGVENLLKFFRQGSIEKLMDYWENPVCSLRHSKTLEGDQLALATWLQIGINEASSINCDPYDEESFKNALTEIRRLTNETPSAFIPKMRDLCARSGVALVFIKELKNAAVNGAARWLARDKATIIVNLRGKKSDIFWFSFFHEAAHVLHGRKRENYVDFHTTKPDDPEERQADDFAGNFLIPETYARYLPSLKTPIQVVAFAKKIEIHPGIVVGRLQHDRIIRFSYMNELRQKYDWADD